MGETETAIPYEELESLINFIDDSQRHWFLFGTYPTEEEGEHFVRHKAFLEALKPLYTECAICERQIAPDETRFNDPPSEMWYCLKCLNEGV